MTNWNPIADTRDDTFYKRPNLLAIVFVPIGLALLSVTFLIPDYAPFDKMGPIGIAALFFVNYLPNILKMMFYVAWSAHFIQGWLALKLCRQKGIDPSTTRLWVLSSFAFGLFSLHHLVNYDPKDEKKNL